jgi:carboxypeptidase PM20D1
MPFYFQAALTVVLALIIFLVVILLIRTLRMHSSPTPKADLPDLGDAFAMRTSESLSSLIGFQTISHLNQMEHGGYGEWLRMRDYLRARYPLVHQTMLREQVGGFSLLFKWSAPESETPQEPLLFCAHMDVVEGKTESWTHPMFSGDTEDGYVWGRGALDCKSILVCILEAAESLISEGFVPSRDIYFAFGHDEEIGGKEGAANLANWFRGQNLRFLMILDEGGCITRSSPPIGRPVAHIGVGEKGALQLKLKSVAQGGQTGEPENHTAVGLLSEAITRIEYRQLPPRMTPVMRFALRTLAKDLPFLFQFAIANDAFFHHFLFSHIEKNPEGNAMIRTTLAPTVIKGSISSNRIAEEAEALVDCHMLQGEHDSVLQQYFHDLTQDLHTEVEILRVSEPSVLSKYTGRTYQMLSSSILRCFGPTPIVPCILATGTDARNYDRLSECVFRFAPFILTPEERKTIHGANERISVQNLQQAVSFYRDLMMNF